MSDDWSTPSLYAGRGRVMEPRTFTEADPISAMLVADWPARSTGDGQNPWSTTTYVGPRRKRPDRRGRGAGAGGRGATRVDSGRSAAGNAGTGRGKAADRGLLANSRSMAIASLVSRITGFLRSALLVAALGVGHGRRRVQPRQQLPEHGVRAAARRRAVQRARSAAGQRAGGRRATAGSPTPSGCSRIATVALGAVTLLAVLCAPLIAAGFVDAGPQRSLTSLFATLLLPEIFFYGLGAMFMAVLNIRHSYGPGAWAPVLNNVVMIVTDRGLLRAARPARR